MKAPFWLCAAASLWAQLTPSFPPVVWKAGDTLRNAWAGGLHAPQFSTMDLNADGQLELIILDRMDNRLLVFERRGPHWQHQPALSHLFPPIHHWMLLRDYDGDGDKDLFTATPIGSNIRVWRNIHPTGSPPLWQLAYDTLKSSYYNFLTYLYSGSIDIPGIADIDGDGDTDLLVYEVLGTLIEWHRNKAMELYNRPDTLALELASACWGHVYENYDYATNQFSFSTYQCSGGQRLQRIQHAGGSILPIQLNGDTLIDLIVGDFGPPYLIAGLNTGTRATAHINPATAQAPYPVSAPAVVPDFPAAYYEEVTGEGRPDLIVANNDALAGQDYWGVWLYPNIGRPDSPAWAPPLIGWLQNTMIDIGTGAHPTFADLNRDGYPDLILSCRSAHRPAGPRPQAWLFQGSPQGFVLSDSNWLDLPQYSALAAPVFTAADIDGNGRLDLLMGTSGGAIWRWEEDSPTSQSFQLISTNFLSVSAEAAPLFYDTDGDGDPDLIVGTRNGRLSYFINQNGSFQLVTDFLGQIEVRDTVSSLLGFARPAILPVPGGPTLLLVGNMTGFLRLYKPDWSSPTALWPVAGDLASSIQSGTFTSPSAWAFNDSTWIAVGIRRGGVMLYQLDGLPSQYFHASAAPVPPTHTVIGMAEGLYLHTTSTATVTLLNALGQTLWEVHLSGSAFYERPPTGGLYLIRIVEGEKVFTHRLFWP